jgi:NAD+ diphosphatase
MKRFYFSGQDILLPVHPCEDAGAAPEAAGMGVVGRREFELGGARYTALMLDEAGAQAGVAAGLRRMPLREALAELSPEAMRPALRGMALLRWLETARFCGACGSPLRDEETDGADPGSRKCSACGRAHFPRISPAVIVLVRKGKRALLAHNARFRPGFFGLVAGFVEAGETLEDAAAREVREEAGIEIRDLRYLKSQPWPFPDSLMVAFRAEWASGEARPDGVEIGELRWCLPAELPSIPPKGSVARYLLDEFAKED